MKAFIASLAFAAVNAYEATTVETIEMSAVTNESPIAQSGTNSGLSVSWMTQKTKTNSETTHMLMMGFTTGLAPNLLSND